MKKNPSGYSVETEKGAIEAEKTEIKSTVSVIVLSEFTSSIENLTVLENSFDVSPTNIPQIVLPIKCL